MHPKVFFQRLFCAIKQIKKTRKLIFNLFILIKGDMIRDEGHRYIERKLTCQRLGAQSEINGWHGKRWIARSEISRALKESKNAVIHCKNLEGMVRN